MAATAKLLKLRPKTLPTTTTSTPSPIHFFSSSTTTLDSTTTSSTQPNPPSPPPPPPHSQSPFSFSFTDLKDNLKQSQPINPQQSQPPRKPFSFQRSPPPNLEEISRNLSEFRRRSAAPPPSPPSSSSAPQHISFQELYQRNVVSKGEESSDSYKKQHSFEAIRESLRHFKPSPSKNPSSQGGRGMDNSISLSRFRESLATRQMDPNVKSSPSDQRVFGVEIKKEEGESGSDGKMRTEFVRTYSREDLGEKLRALRPEKMDKKDWFSLEELSQRLVKLRELEEKESNSKFLGIPFKDLRESIEKLSLAEAEGKKSPMQRIDILGHLGRTPDYMLYPPKEELVEKYFHPDNMSASEKLKLELMKVRDEFKMSESDCGSARVQVAQLTTKIKHLSTALHKKDKHSRKGLEAMVQRRKKLLKYLRRTDWDSYYFVLSKLGLRDNVDLAKRGYKT